MSSRATEPRVPAPEPRCGRCGSACELVDPEGDPWRWECTQCWIYMLIPRTSAALPGRLVRSCPWPSQCLILLVPRVPLDEQPQRRVFD